MYKTSIGGLRDSCALFWCNRAAERGDFRLKNSRLGVENQILSLKNAIDFLPFGRAWDLGDIGESAGVLFRKTGYGFHNSSGSLAIFTAIRRALLLFVVSLLEFGCTRPHIRRVKPAKLD
jgi:hypothetical protein